MEGSLPPPSPERKTPVRQDAGEREFCRAWISGRQQTQARFAIRLSVPVHIGSLLLLPTFAAPMVLPYLMLLHGVLLVLSIVAIIFTRHRRVHDGILSLGIAIDLIGYEAILYVGTTMLVTPRDVLLGTAGVMAYTAYGLQFYPGAALAVAPLGAVLLGGAFWSMAGAQGGLIWAAIYGTMIVFALSMRFVADLRLRREAQREYRFRSQVVPAQIVRRAVSETDDLQALFRPELKPCVCLSTDWRNYQELSANVPASQLVMTLNAYYDLCQTLLDRCLPEGNYFCDWIADELFVVLFEPEAGKASGLADVAVRFATELIQAKGDFLRLHGLPRAIDVGISVGDAVIGLMGPSGLRKATAMGETPGRARRLQSAGKLLRRKRGEADRIVFGRECLMRLTSPQEVLPHVIPDGESIRDLKDRELFFVEPATTVKAPLGRSA